LPDIWYYLYFFTAAIPVASVTADLLVVKQEKNMCQETIPIFKKKVPSLVQLHFDR